METLTVIYLFELLADTGKYLAGIAAFFLAINTLLKKKNREEVAGSNPVHLLLNILFL